LLHEIVPNATVVAALINPARSNAESEFKELQVAAGSLGLTLHPLHASSESDFERAFAQLSDLRAGGLVIAGDPFFNNRREELGQLAFRHAVPAIYQFREFVVAGGLMSYGSDFGDMFRRLGAYAGRILKGEQPADLPVQQSTKVELIINLKTAKTLGLTVPTALLVRADEVIE
jgi:putative ABC transport system substrate-binding protein